MHAHANKHALGGIPQARYAGPFDAALTRFCSCCCSTRVATKCEMTRTQLSSLTIDALAFALPPSPHPVQSAPSSQEIPQGCCNVRLHSSSAGSCFREVRLGHQQQGPFAIGQQVRARWLPETDRGRPVVAIMLSGSLPQ